MSQFTYEPLPAEQSNGLAIAGFVCSLLGIFTGFLLSPIGLILSLVALGRPGGRGFAVAEWSSDCSGAAAQSSRFYWLFFWEQEPCLRPSVWESP